MEVSDLVGLLGVVGILGMFWAFSPHASANITTPASAQQVKKGVSMKFPITKTDDEWRKQLTPQQFAVSRGHGTEPAFTGEYWNNHEKGIYECVCCRTPLFESTTKFDSGTGWPSFYQPIARDRVVELEDHTYGMDRTEVLCAKCGAHLGHVFDDGPKPTGLRFCMNSASLHFEKSK
jgi:peptide-methionine (R)-S-oxide reductase